MSCNWSSTLPPDGKFFFVRHDRMEPTMAFRLGEMVYYFGEDLVEDGRKIEEMPDSAEYQLVHLDEE